MQTQRTPNNAIIDKSIKACRRPMEKVNEDIGCALYVPFRTAVITKLHFPQKDLVNKKKPSLTSGCKLN